MGLPPRLSAVAVHPLKPLGWPSSGGIQERPCDRSRMQPGLSLLAPPSGFPLTEGDLFHLALRQPGPYRTATFQGPHL